MSILMRKKINKALAVILVLACVLVFYQKPVFAKELSLNETNIAMDVKESNQTNETRSTNITFTGSTVTFTLTKNISKFDYTSAATTQNPSSGFVLVRFTNVNTGTYCTHSLGVSNLGGHINCNMTAGTYQMTQVGGTSGLGYRIYITF